MTVPLLATPFHTKGHQREKLHVLDQMYFIMQLYSSYYRKELGIFHLLGKSVNHYTTGLL